MKFGKHLTTEWLKENDVNIWVTSDLHFNHKGILDFNYGFREFDNVAEMNEAIIAHWNNLVGPNDFVFHLGDFSFGNKQLTSDIIGMLNGTIIFIMGNHDGISKYRDHSCYHYFELSLDDVKICMSHYPMDVWNKCHHGALMLHGHCHGNHHTPRMGRRIDVGLDSLGTIANLKDLVSYMGNVKISQNDHHVPTRKSYEPRPVDNDTYLIFADIDGVLNNANFGNGDVIWNEHGFMDRGLITNFNTLIKQTGAKVVLSSTWRLGLDIPKAQAMFESFGVECEVVGITPQLGEGTVRGNEIHKWIEEHSKRMFNVDPTSFKQYIILDDDSDMLLWQEPHYINIGAHVGLTENQVWAARRKLMSLKNLPNNDYFK